MKIVRWMVVLVLVLLLAGCDILPEETLAPETTVPTTAAAETSVPETTVPETTVPETTVPETTQAPTEPPETTVSRDVLRVGYYVLEEASYKGEPLGEEFLTVLQSYIQIREGHVGSMYFNSAMHYLDWTNRFLIINGAYNPYTIEDDVITLTYNWDYTLVLRYCGDTLPERYGLSQLEPGLYLLWSVFYPDANGILSGYMIEDPGLEKGYILLRPDGTGLHFNGIDTANVDWSGGAIKIMSMAMTHFFLGPEETREGAMLALEFPTGEIGYYLRVNGDDYEDADPGRNDV